MDFSKRGFSLFKPERWIRSIILAPVVLCAAVLIGAGPAQAQTRNFPFRATNYDVEVSFTPKIRHFRTRESRFRGKRSVTNCSGGIAPGFAD